MASFKRNRTKPWKARVRVKDSGEYFLGYFATEEEALCWEFDYGRPLPRCECEAHELSPPAPKRSRRQ